MPSCTRCESTGSLNILGCRIQRHFLSCCLAQYSAQMAWVGAQGILDEATASLMSGDINQLEATTADAAAAAAAGGSTPTWQQPDPEGSSTPVNSSLYTHPSEHYLQWRGSDRSFREYVPVRGKPVCVAALGVPPPAVAGSQPRGIASPGLYLFTCRRPTAFICQCECERDARRGSGSVTTSVLAFCCSSSLIALIKSGPPSNRHLVSNSQTTPLVPSIPCCLFHSIQPACSLEQSVGSSHTQGRPAAPGRQSGRWQQRPVKATLGTRHTAARPCCIGAGGGELCVCQPAALAAALSEHATQESHGSAKQGLHHCCSD